MFVLTSVARKYRDEPRPRHGLLRAREFLMKDLYTFDASIEDAMQTYEIVRKSYTAFFDEFKIPYLTAEASSGEIGGDLSHEYQFPSSNGEDNIVSCDTCNYVTNEELTEFKSGKVTKHNPEDLIENVSEPSGLNFNSWNGVTKDRTTLVVAILPKRAKTSGKDEQSWRSTRVNRHALKRVFSELDLGVEEPLIEFQKTPSSQRKILPVFDERLPPKSRTAKEFAPIFTDSKLIHYAPTDEDMLHASTANLIRPEAGDACPRCENGTIKIQPAIELGHTFHLGTRYSEPLGATFPTPTKPDSTINEASPSTPIQMGCHGIGVSRLIATMADILADSRGLNWPSVIAPFQAVVISTNSQKAEGHLVYDLLTSSRTSDDQSRMSVEIDTILDDRANRDFGWKLKDADMIGYPVIVVIGRDWKTKSMVEVQCRRLGIKEAVGKGDLRRFVAGLLERL